jgi:hypothetical protein
MVNPEGDPIQLRLLAGRGDRPTFLLAPSTKPVSVGTQGDWVVTAEGVGPIHFFLAFDGTHVYLTPASQGHTVLLGGVPLGTGWTVAAVPSDLRFAGARVALERAWPSAPGPDDAPAPLSTVSDGGALFEAAQRALQDIPLEFEPPKPVHARPFDATLAGPQPSSRPTSETPREAPLSATITMERNSSPLARRISLPPGGATMTAGPGLDMLAGALPSAVEGRNSQAPSTPDPPGAPASRSWQEASIPKKITLALMPFAIAASYYLLFHVPARAPATRPAASTGAGPVVTPASAHAATQDALVPREIGEVAPPSASSSIQPAPAVPGKGTSPRSKVAARTAERAALDAVAAGDFRTAADDYAGLAAAHPEDTSFKDAARILNEKAAHGR